MIVGENGIFTKAQEAKKAQTIAEANEKIGTEILTAQIEAMENNEELEQSQVEAIVAKYGVLQADGDTIILNDTEYEVSLRDIYNTMAEVETDGDSTTELAQLKALLAQTTVTEDKILKDYKAYKDGKLITGTMANYAGATQDATATSDEDYTYISIPNNGYYTTESKLKIENENIIGDYNSGRFRFCSMNDNNYLGYIGYTELNVKDYSTLTVNVTSTYNISKVLIRKNDGSTKLLEVTTTGVLDVSEYDEIQITAVVSNQNVQGTITGTYTLTK